MPRQAKASQNPAYRAWLPPDGVGTIHRSLYSLLQKPAAISTTRSQQFRSRFALTGLSCLRKQPEALAGRIAARPVELQESKKRSRQHLLQGASFNVRGIELHDAADRGRHADLLPQLVHLDRGAGDTRPGRHRENLAGAFQVEMLLKRH